MATTTSIEHAGTTSPSVRQAAGTRAGRLSDPVFQAYLILRTAFVVAPIVFGVDKFTNILTRWEQYLNPLALRVVPVTAETFMRGVGVIEIVAGALLLAKPRIGAPIVMAWLLAIALQLLAGWMYLDVAVRDITMSLGALTLWRLTALLQEEERPIA